TSHQAKEALKKYGLNKLPEKKTTSVLEMLAGQVKNPFSFLLLGATVLSFIVGDKLDSFLIGGILVLNTLLGFWQEYKASKELEALRKLEVAFARVERDGKQVQIPATELVPGDVVILESGDKIPADGQLVEAHTLQINEAILTGESLPVQKSTKTEENLVFFATTVVSGRGKFLVLQTGINTKFGNLAEKLAAVEGEQTPFEKTLAGLSRILGIIALLAAAVIFILRTLQGYDLSATLLGSIAFMVAVVPEGLPAFVTIILAMGMRRMYKRKALVRKMIAVESLGAATVICTDKTGTLTKNEMRVQEIKSEDSKKADLIKCAVLCNSASLVLKETHLEGEEMRLHLRGGDNFDVLGDSTEGALLLWAKDEGIDIDLMRSELKLIEEIPFNLEARKMTTTWEQGGKKSKYQKGAPEVFALQSKWEQEYKKMAAKGLRVLAFSRDDKFLGLIGIADEIRPEVKDAIRLTKNAGIKVVMVTGDNELTAKAVGEKVGLLSPGDEVLTGAQLNSLDEEEFLQRIGRVRIFARITPQDKLRIVKAYQSLGEVVAVTGDGVNDALALKQAEVGVSMGKIGTDVAKEASDIILLDDNFATLVTAVEQGRLIYSNILKVIRFLLTGNLSEMLLILGGAVFGLPTPLLPIQILWINFVTDGPPALALGFDSASAHLMQTPPRKKLTIFNYQSLRFIIFGGILIATLLLFAFYLTLQSLGLETARATIFSGMVIAQMILPFIMRRHHGVLSNKKLFFSVAAVLLIQLLILTYPPLRSLFL
ncbi:cation-translocating P-type ATPase, partial [Candidatus Daviesbacteria bacterium]|nr:cation-translocating P-type ATPase [Candidatus Daviesbacteria bacterium]